MDDRFRLPIVLLLAVHVFLTIGCASTSGSDGSPAPPSDPGVGSAPDQGAPNPGNAGEIGSDRGDNVSKDVTSTVEALKGRDFSVPRRGVFLSAGLRELERDADEAEERVGSASDITNLSIGYDQLVSDAWVLGSLIDLSRRETLAGSDVDESSLSSDTFSLYVFSNLALNESSDVSAYVGAGRSTTDSSRNVQNGNVDIMDRVTGNVQTIQVQQGEVQGDTLSQIFSVGVFASRRIDIAAGSQLIFSAEADFSRINTDAFLEQGATNSELAYRKDTRDSVRGVLSIGANRVFGTSIGVLVPAVTVSYVNENIDDDAIIAEVIAEPGLTTAIDAAPTDRDYGMLDLGLVWVRPRGVQFFGNVTSRFANRFEDSAGLNVGARLEF